MIRNHTKRKN